MSYAARHDLARLLVGESGPSRHSASLHLPAESLEIAVEGFGRVHLPLKAATAKKLIPAARQAHVGKGTETLLDDSVRDTWEIPAEQVSIGGEHWESTLGSALKELGAELGISPAARLRPELHSLLIYGTGQFFAPHQDSEKGDAMVATLVVSLPTFHTGGELVIDDGGMAVKYRASDYELTLVAFYADRRHEVLPVRRGYRASLTFNLMLEGDEKTPHSPTGAAARLLQEHFSTPPESSWRRSGQPPGILGVLLDHEYSRHGLNSGLFKGADVERIATLMAAAELAGYEYAFAHANVQETHQTYDEGPYGWSDYYDDDEEEEEHLDAEDLEIGELVDSSVELTWWNDAHAQGEISLYLVEDEVCAVTPSEAIDPYESEYEGYMGNYGNTIERWYHRTVMLIWPAHRGNALRAEANPEWALSGAVRALESGDLEAARMQAQALVAVSSKIPAPSLTTLLELAAGVDDPDLAHLLLTPFPLQSLTPGHAPLLAQLVDTYGSPWWEHLLDSWEPGRRPTDPTPRSWIEKELPHLTAKLVKSGATAAAEELIKPLTTWFDQTLSAVLTNDHAGNRSKALASLGSTAAALLQTGEHLVAPTESFVELLVTPGEAALPLLTAALHALANQPRSEGGVRLAQEAHRLLSTALARPPRADGDWSIPWESPGEEDADRLAEFLADHHEATFEWPLAAPRRRRIHWLIDGADLPVEHITRRVGSPYTLVLTKTSELFTREAALREEQEQDKGWIEIQYLPWR